jgi:hypothetical protein
VNHKHKSQISVCNSQTQKEFWVSSTRLIETSIHMCWASWGGRISRIPPNAVGGNIPLASGSLLYNQHNTNSTQNTQPHTTTNHNKMARHRATSATASTTAHSPQASAPAQFSSSPHHGRRRARSVLYFFALWGLLGAPKRRPIMK